MPWNGFGLLRDPLRSPFLVRTVESLELGMDSGIAGVEEEARRRWLKSVGKLVLTP